MMRCFVCGGGGRVLRLLVRLDCLMGSGRGGMFGGFECGVGGGGGFVSCDGCLGGGFEDRTIVRGTGGGLDWINWRG